MRFLIREQDFEIPVASGRFQLQQGGQATGDFETWRITQIARDYQFLRVDRDMRGIGTAQGILYHMLLNPERLPERLKIRVLSMENSLLVDILFDGDLVSATGERNGQRFEQELHPSANSIFYFSSAMGLSLLLLNGKRDEMVSAVSFDIDTARLINDKAIRIREFGREVIDLGQRQVDARPCLIEWPERQITLWLDDYNLPLKVDYGNGLVASDTHFIRYQN